MKIENLPNFLYTDDFNNTMGLQVHAHKLINLKPHRHEFYELEFVLDGEADCVINGEYHRLYAGDFVFITPLDIHSYTVIDGIDAHFLNIHFHLDHLSKDFLILAELPTAVIRNDPDIKEAFRVLHAETSGDQFQYLAQKNLLERIMILFLRKTRENLLLHRNIPLEITYAIGYINKHFNNPLTLEEVAQKCRYSTAHFCKQFKKYTGKSFVEYLTDLRIKHARNMLISQKLSVTQISYECGFGSVRSLNRIFREKYGCSPSEYLKFRSTQQEEQP